MQEEILDFIKNNWTIIVGLGATIAYIIEKIISFNNGKKKKRESYNRVFTGLIKLYYSYIKHKGLYSEKAIFGVPDEEYIQVVKHIDTFDSDIQKFQNLLIDEVEIVPEISLKVHTVFEIIDRFGVIDRIGNSGIPNTEISDEEKLSIKRAQFFALDEFLSDFFKDIIEEIAKKTSVKKKFINDLFYLGSDEHEKETFDEQLKLIKRYYESLNRQGKMPNEVFMFLTNQLEQNN